MPNVLPAPPPAHEVHLSALACELGDPVDIALLDDPGVARRLDALTAEGLRHCRVSERSAPHLGAASARATLAAADGHVPDWLVLATESRAPSPTQVLWETLQSVPLPRTPGLVVGGNGCGNFAPALRAAHGLLLTEGVPGVLLTLADRLTTPSRFMPDGNTVMSDSAASCLVTVGPPGRPSFRVLAVATSVQAGLVPEERVLKGARTILKAVREALGRINDSVPDPERGFDWFVTGNYSATTRRFLATAAQMSEEKAYSPHHASYGHCYSADQLITLAALEADGRLAHGERVLLLGTSARSWSLTALERVVP
ncbi:3-oxoacyl-[acyl-carrier-protein] synthase III C-terminal domain-containing protein [Streptomyces sp. NPDC045251]|uniref:3-oxoacyl-[acyl-carrier-protein] synthase III C-terminal domain-containing protein n=1 Tax=unclassified Streptomyces TaxID=2593676 RepID=UPI0033CCE4AD